MTLPVALLTRSWFLAGPTAVGKTAVSLLLAERLGAEIISLDSMSIYRGMDIGTAKPDLAARQRVPHHLLDVADPHEEFSVAEFLRMAATAAAQIVARGRVPLFVGGTGLYLRTVLRGLVEGPPADWDLRRQLAESAAEHGELWLHTTLQQVDPAAAARLHPRDTRRLIRALEVYQLTGRRLSDEQTQHPRPAEEQPQAVVWLEPPRAWLYERIHTRVDNMLQAGLLAEVSALLQRTPPAGRTALQALGYRELIAHLQGQCSLEQAVEQIRTGTRQFAKRQHTWFRNLPECRSLTISGSETPSQLADQIVALARPAQPDML